MMQESKIFSSIHALKVPKESYSEELEERAISYIFGYSMLLVENKRHNIKDLERSYKKRLRIDPGDQDALFDKMLVFRRRARVFVRYYVNRTWELVTEKIPVRRGKPPDPYLSYAISRLAVVWKWKTSKRPRLTLSDEIAYESAQPGDEFFFWAADLIHDHMGARRYGLEKKIFYIYRNLSRNSFFPD